MRPQKKLMFDISLASLVITVLGILGAFYFQIIIDEIQKEIEGINAYKYSIEEGKNYCSNYPRYNNLFNLYELTINEIDCDPAIPKEEIGSSKKRQYFNSISEADRSLETLESELKTAQANLKENELALEMGKQDQSETGESLSVSMASAGKLSDIMAKLDVLDAQLDEIDAQIKQLETQVKQGDVRASRVVNETTNVIRGDVVSAGTSLATIIPDDESRYKVQLYVSNADIGNVEIGDEVKYNLAAFPSSQYGTIEGRVTYISKDVLTRNGSYSGYYLVEATIDSKDLKDKDGNLGKLAAGMETEAKIVTQKKSIIRYLLEKINLF